MSHFRENEINLLENQNYNLKQVSAVIGKKALPE